MLRASLSIGASCSVGDAVCQHLSSSSEWDAKRTASFAASGLFVLGPISYGILTTATRLVPGTSTLELVRRIVLIQAIEPFRMGIFLPTTVLLSGAAESKPLKRSIDQAIEKVRSDALPTALRSWCVFTPVLFISFRYMRPENRVPLLACVGAAWNSYMSYVAHRRLS